MYYTTHFEKCTQLLKSAFLFFTPIYRYRQGFLQSTAKGILKNHTKSSGKTNAVVLFDRQCLWFSIVYGTTWTAVSVRAVENKEDIGEKGDTDANGKNGTNGKNRIDIAKTASVESSTPEIQRDIRFPLLFPAA